MSIIRPRKNIVSTTGRILIGLLCLLLVASTTMITKKASAYDYPKLINRSLTVVDVSPGATTRYTISYRFPAPTTFGSVRFEICDSAVYDDPCVNPSADLSAATLTSQTGINDFSILSQSAGEIVMTRTFAFAGTVQSTYVFDNIINPSGLPQNFFIRISTYLSADGTGNFEYFSAVASATTEPIVITSIVPPILYFCAGLTVDEWCANVSGNYIDYGDLTPVIEDAGVSQFGAATNAAGGYVVTVNGDTMTAGNKLIAALSVPDVNTPGTPQFGINLRANTNPALGQDAFGAGIGTVAVDYDTPDMYKYADGDTVATAITGSMFNTFTVTYIVNVPADQPSGVYNTTIAYICTAAF